MGNKNIKEIKMILAWDVVLLNSNPNTVVKVQSGPSLAPDLTAKRRRERVTLKVANASEAMSKVDIST